MFLLDVNVFNFDQALVAVPSFILQPETRPENPRPEV